MILAALMLAIPPAPACVQVSGERLLAGELAAAAPALSSLPPETDLGYAPAPGARRLVSAAELARVLERHGVRGEAPAGLCVERRTQKLTRESVEAALRAALRSAAAPGAPEVRLEVLDFSRYPAPPGELEFARAGLPAPPRPGVPVVWRGHVRYGNHRSLPVWARVRLAVAGDGMIAAESLSAGKPIEEHQVRRRGLEWFPFSEAPAREMGEVVGRIPRRAIPAGAPIRSSELEPAHEVERGESVTVEVLSGAAQLRFQARAESSGSAGDAVLLRNPSNGRTFSGRVEGAGKVTVDANTLENPAQRRAAGPVGPDGRGGRPR
jgi:flagella basal body P-ring formation protein FlgA